MNIMKTFDKKARHMALKIQLPTWDILWLGETG